ncbi:(d)CMP kinase [Legionella londiniensis]|uniref:Cytidylate kinase n=1 Tax=Legionella londiniensis TaxID=45068 RepID=A0A0W0VQA5_9GAMM|nr:(d)CMP kinase [Legionella londiniensis]KTD22347.1 cytidylate kinase [Legionella londiniensis]STX93079.1 cytidylate kinase [Legionella londiniensis]
MTNNHVPIITLDGPSGTGKGTISLRLANHLNWNFLDSGAIYRVLALAANKKNIGLSEKNKLAALAGDLDFHFKTNDSKCRIFLEGKDVSEEIRSEQCGQDASIVASIPEVREALLAKQRDFARPPGLVTDGRDMGTVVFPNADLKIYLYATEEERIKRRYLQLKEKENDVSLAQVAEELRSRDERDKNRAHAPLRPADDAVFVDTTRLTVVQVFNYVLKLVNDRILNQ